MHLILSRATLGNSSLKKTKENERMMVMDEGQRASLLLYLFLKVSWPLNPARAHCWTAGWLRTLWGLALVCCSVYTYETWTSGHLERERDHNQLRYHNYEQIQRYLQILIHLEGRGDKQRDNEHTYVSPLQIYEISVWQNMTKWESLTRLVPPTLVSGVYTREGWRRGWRWEGVGRGWCSLRWRRGWSVCG